MEVVYTPKCDTSHKKGRKEGELAHEVMRFDSFQVCSLFVGQYLLFIKNKDMWNSVLESFIDFRAQYLFTGLCKSGQSRVSINAKTRANIG